MARRKRDEFSERVHTTLVKEFAEGGIRLSDDHRHWCMNCENSGKGTEPMGFDDTHCLWVCVECGHTMDF